jgi:hypothetical protein
MRQLGNLGRPTAFSENCRAPAANVMTSPDIRPPSGLFCVGITVRGDHREIGMQGWRATSRPPGNAFRRQVGDVAGHGAHGGDRDTAEQGGDGHTPAGGPVASRARRRKRWRRAAGAHARVTGTPARGVAGRGARCRHGAGPVRFLLLQGRRRMSLGARFRSRSAAGHARANAPLSAGHSARGRTAGTADKTRLRPSPMSRRPAAPSPGRIVTGQSQSPPEAFG